MFSSVLKYKDTTHAALLLAFVLQKGQRNFSKKGQMKGYFSSNKDICGPFL